MFRSMRRFKQALDEKECIELLKTEKRGVLSVLGDGGYPYGIPLDHWYCQEDGRLYFHCAKEGHKLDAVKACDKVSYCVFDKGYTVGDDWALHVKSVVIFGRMSIVEDEEKKREICTELVRKFTDDEAYLKAEFEKAFPRVCCLCLTPEHMSGKKVTES